MGCDMTTKQDNRAKGRPMGPPRTLRDLRLWHWRLVVSNRASARDMEAQGRQRQARALHGKADWHLSAVQALNDVVSGTAEADDQKVIRI